MRETDSQTETERKTRGGGGGGGERERDRQTETERQRERRQDKIILLSGLRPITTGVNIQAVRILIDPMTDLNSVF